MVSWFRNLLRRRPSEDELLNEGLGLAMDWGESWLSPINARLHRLHPRLSAAELEESNAACQGAMRSAYEAVYAMLAVDLDKPSAEALAAAVRAKYPWVNDENVLRLLNQGTYYAAKMGGHARES